MNLIKYEYFTEEDGAYYHYIGKLVKMVRHYRENVSIEEFNSAITELKKLEQRLQDIDVSLSLKPRNYLQEIMEELKAESELEENLISEIERTSNAIASALYDTNFSMSQFSFEFRNINAAQWVEFYGYKDSKQTDGVLLVVKEVFRSVCYKFGIVFIDSSLSEQ